MKITLSQAVVTSASIVKRIQELLRERQEISIVKAPKGETYTKPVRSFQVVTTEIAEAREDLGKLDYLKHVANVQNTIEWNGKNIAIIQAIELAKQLRLEANEFKGFGARKQQDLENGGWGANTTQTIVYAQYDTEKARLRGIKLNSIAERLSTEIDKANDKVEIWFAEASKYIAEDTVVEEYTE